MENWCMRPLELTFVGLQEYTPVPASQYPKDHSTPSMAMPPWKTPPSPI